MSQDGFTNHQNPDQNPDQNPANSHPNTGQPEGEDPGRPADRPTGRPAGSPLDRVVTVLLLVGLALLAPIAGFLGLLTAMASDGCMANTCNGTLMTLGVGTSAISPVAVGVAALVWVIVRWVRGRSTWWVPLIAVAAGAGLWILGAAMTAASVG